MTSSPEEAGILLFGVDLEVRWIGEELCIFHMQTQSVELLEQRPAEAKYFDIGEFLPEGLRERQTRVIHGNEDNPSSRVTQEFGMTFRLIQDYQVIAAVQNLSEIEVVFSEPALIPTQVHCPQIVEQIKKEPVGARLAMMTMADVGNLQLSEPFPKLKGQTDHGNVDRRHTQLDVH